MVLKRSPRRDTGTTRQLEQNVQRRCQQQNSKTSVRENTVQSFLYNFPAHSTGPRNHTFNAHTRASFAQAAVPRRIPPKGSLEGLDGGCTTFVTLPTYVTLSARPT